MAKITSQLKTIRRTRGNLYMKKIFLYIIQTKFYKWLLKHIIPYIRFSTYYTDFKGEWFYQGYKLLEPADIILCVDNRKLTTLLIGGEWSHAALCVSKDEVWEISEMTHNDYEKSTFFDICKTSDRVCILRCLEWSEGYKKRVIRACRDYEMANYDLSFEMGVEALFCSELIYMSDIKRTLDVSLDDIASIGRQYISPTGLYKAKNLKVIWDSDK